LKEEGVPIGVGSDFPFMTLNPFEAIETGITRRHPAAGPDREPLLMEHGLDLGTLLEAMTINAAHQIYREDELGSIEVGKSASLTLIDRDLFETAPEDISETRVLMTMIDGDIVHLQ
jgi:predicted amidohydrolase YtcJ